MGRDSGGEPKGPQKEASRHLFLRKIHAQNLLASRAALGSAFEKMDLVTREEMEVQEKVLLRTREKLESLLIRLDQLERELHDKSTEEPR